MATGTLVAESVAVGAALHGLDLVLRGIERVEPTDLSDGQRAAGIPARWTLLRFDVDDAKAAAFAEALAGVLDEPGWYADLHTVDESFVVFAGRVFRYPMGDQAGRAAAEAHAREHGVPEPQIDWP
jgi:hypothetical protein